VLKPKRSKLSISLREMFRPPSIPISIEARVLQIDDQMLVFEFETPVDGFMLPGGDVDVDVLFDDAGGTNHARVLGRESSKPGPHPAGLTVRLALKLKGDRCWHHNAARIHWKANSVYVEIRIALGTRR